MPITNYSKKDEKKKTKKEIQELISKEIIEISENKKNGIPNSIEKCVCCGTDTIWRRNISIHMISKRKCYTIRYVDDVNVIYL